MVAVREGAAHALRRSVPLISHCTKLAQGILLFTCLAVAVGQTAAQMERARVNVAEPCGAGDPDQSSDADGSPDVSPEALALECEDVEVESEGRASQDHADGPAVYASTLRHQPHGSATQLVGRDAVACHAARGPPV